MPTTPAPTLPVIDPTKNVLDVVAAESRFQNAMRDAERVRVNDLAKQKDDYDKRIADMLAKSVDTSSNLLSAQLSEMRAGLGLRISELERFRYESSGKSGGLQAGWGYLVGALGAAAIVISIVFQFIPNA